MDIRSLLTFTLTEGVGQRIVGNLLAAFGSLDEAAAAPTSALRKVSGIGRKLSDRIDRIRSSNAAQLELDQAAEMGATILAWTDEDYPAPLRMISDAPVLLYRLGTWLPADHASVAIVGSRGCTPYGKSQAVRFSRSLTRKGLTIISGLARGIDTAAHWGALKAGGRTVAVIGSGLGRIYPPENEQLAQALVKQGCIFSEFNLKASPTATNFPRRNRIVSALSMAVMVIEAPERSGSLNTAQWAAEQGRDVYALPANVDSAASQGSLALLRDGAAPAMSPDHIFEDLVHRLATTLPNADANESPAQLDLTPDEQSVHACLGSSPTDIEALIEQTGLEPGVVSATLLQLELAGHAETLPGNLYVRSA